MTAIVQRSPIRRSALALALFWLVPLGALGQQPASGDALAPEFRWDVANPDLLQIGNTDYMYFRGNRGGHDRIGCAAIPRDRFDGVTRKIADQPDVDEGGPCLSVPGPPKLQLH